LNFGFSPRFTQVNSNLYYKVTRVSTWLNLLHTNNSSTKEVSK
jgi:hypothetical protein